MSLKFLAISDFGAPTPQLKSVAKAMDAFVQKNGPVNMIFGLGDNFYPSGVRDIHDQQFKKSWRDVFLKYHSLRVPWKIILGNHDYMDNPTAEIEYTYSKYNSDGLWQLPDFCYDFSIPLDEENIQTVDFFGLDSNACQDHVVFSFPEVKDRMHLFVANLKEKLKSSTARWKIVFAHHPLYTGGKGHLYPAVCLRERSYFTRKNTEIIEREGFNLEEALVEGDVDLYLCGHEHIFQHHFAKGIHHVCCGASGADVRRGSGYYGGLNQDVVVDWHGNGDQLGFVYGEISVDKIDISFIDSENNCVLRNVRIEKPFTDRSAMDVDEEKS